MKTLKFAKIDNPLKFHYVKKCMVSNEHYNGVILAVNNDLYCLFPWFRPTLIKGITPANNFSSIYGTAIYTVHS
jgi:hypothetical protein